MPSLTVTPNPATPGEAVSVDGSGFDFKAKFALTTVDSNGVESGFDETTGFPSNINRPRKDGTFHIGIYVPPTEGPAKVRAYSVIKKPSGSTVGELLAEAPVIVRVVAPEPEPVDPEPEISNVVVTPTATGAGIEWHVSKFAKGWIKHGLTPAYGSETNHEESFTYQDHFQTIAGYGAGLTVHFSVVAEDTAGQRSESPGQFVTASAPEPPPPVPEPPPTLYPPTRPAVTFVATNGDPRPGYLAEITDSKWGTEIRRITNTTQWKNNYPKHQPWNADSSIIYLGNGKRFLDGKTYADLNKAWPGGVEYPVWSNVNPDRMWGCSNDKNVFKRFSFAAMAWTVIHTFAGKGHISLGEYEGNISDDDTRVALIFKTTIQSGSGSWGVLVYDPVNDREISSRTFGPGTEWKPNNCSISRSGAYVVVNHGTAGANVPNKGVWLYRSSDMQPVRQIMATQRHADMGKDANGEDIYVHMGGSGGLRSHHCASGVSVDLFGSAPITQLDSGHVSCTNYDRPGWAYISSNGRSTKLGSDQLLAVKTDGSGEIQVFAFAHAEGLGTYQFSPHMAASRDGARVIFGSTWGDGSQPMYCYVAGMKT